MDVSSADRAERWDDYQAAETKLHDALDEAFLTPELRVRIDNAYADCIGAARRDVLGSLVIGIANFDDGFDGVRRPLT